MSWVKGYQGVNAYTNFCKDNFATSKRIIPGQFYVYNYKFKEKGVNKQALKLYDFFPCVFIFQATDTYCTGINFHQLPVQIRHEWFARVLAINKSAQEIIPFIDFKERHVYKIKGLNYPLVYKILKKSKIAIRRYRYDRMRFVRIVNITLLSELMKFMSKTYFDATIVDINRRFAALGDIT